MKLLWFLIGVGVGATVSLFLAPASGAEMREALSDAAAGAVEVAEARMGDVAQKAKDAVEKVKKRASKTAVQPQG